MTEREKLQEYFNHPALNQSKLKALLKNGVWGLKKQEENEKTSLLYYHEDRSFIIGQAADTLLTRKSDFDAEYYVPGFKKPSAAIISIITEVYEGRKSDDLSENKSLIHHTCNRQQFSMNLAKEDLFSDTRVSSVITKGAEYWKSLFEADGKQILQESEIEAARSIADSIERHYAAYELLISENADEEIFHQKDYYFTFPGTEIPCKMLADHVKFNHKKKTIQVTDIKTMWGNPKYFPLQVRDYRYDIQAAFYVTGLSILFPDYDILPFKFIVETTDKGMQGEPLIYICSNQLLSAGIYGTEPVYHEKSGRLLKPEQKGILAGIDLYNWHMENGFSKDKVLSENDNTFVLTPDEALSLKDYKNRIEDFKL